MALCDKLENEQFNNLKTHEALVKSLLETLTEAADANELHAAWKRMSTHFDTLFCLFLHLSSVFFAVLEKVHC